MASKLTALTNLAVPGTDDIFYVVDDPGGSPLSRKATLGSLPLNASGMYLDSGAASQTLTTQNTWYQVTQFAANMASSSLFTPDHTNDRILVSGRTGLYEVGFQVSFSGTGNANYQLAAYYNGVALPAVKCERKLGAAGDVGSASAWGIVNIGTSGQYLTLYVRCTSAAGSSFGATHMQLSVKA